jgi:hypothetical protein
MAAIRWLACASWTSTVGPARRRHDRRRLRRVPADHHRAPAPVEAIAVGGHDGPVVDGKGGDPEPFLLEHHDRAGALCDDRHGLHARGRLGQELRAVVRDAVARVEGIGLREPGDQPLHARRPEHAERRGPARRPRLQVELAELGDCGRSGSACRGCRRSSRRRTRQSARLFHELGPVSTIQNRPAANTAVHVFARLGCGSGADVPQRATRSASGARSQSAEATRCATMRRMSRSCTAGMRNRRTPASARTTPTPMVHPSARRMRQPSSVTARSSIQQNASEPMA